MVTAIVLTVLAVTCRFSSAVFGVWNFVPMGAVALYAGSRLPRRWAWIVPVAAMALADLAIDEVVNLYGTQRPLFELTRWTIYGTFAASTFLGLIANRPGLGRWLLPVLSVGVSSLFFATSNLATWADGLLYPLTLPGLVLCYGAALPFFGQTVLADLLGTAVLFGLGPVVERVAPRVARLWPAESRRELKPVEIHEAS